MTPALQVTNLRVDFATDNGPVAAVESVSIHVNPGRTLCMVGESGSGKSVSILATMGLLDTRRTHITADVLRLGDRDLLGLDTTARRRLNGDRLAMVFQDPMTALNPYLTIGVQLAEVLEVHRAIPRAQALDRAAEMLTAVGIPAAQSRLGAYPHALSGGMRQRVVLAMALMCEPDVLLADEPTTALDVTIQAQVLQLLKDSQTRLGMALVLVTHDMGVVAHMADDVAVLYGGQVVEQAPVRDLFAAPRHPYTRALLGSIASRDDRGHPLRAIHGTPPSAAQRPAGCVFAPRCPLAVPACKAARPQMEVLGPHRTVRCIRHAELADA